MRKNEQIDILNMNKTTEKSEEKNLLTLIIRKIELFTKNLICKSPWCENEALVEQ